MHVSRKSIVNYEFDEKESDLRDKKSITDFSSCDPISSSETTNSVQPIAFQNSEGDHGAIPQKEDVKDILDPMGLESEAPEQEGNPAQCKPCVQCHLRHLEPSCPVEHPFHVWCFYFELLINFFCVLFMIIIFLVHLRLLEIL